MNRVNANKKITTGIAALLFSLALMPLSSGTDRQAQNQQQSEPQTAPSNDIQIKNDVVYVCACLKTKSCPCMTEAKSEGPCACGTGGGPPMKAVPSNSSWAKTNRKALAQ